MTTLKRRVGSPLTEDQEALELALFRTEDQERADTVRDAVCRWIAEGGYDDVHIFVIAWIQESARSRFSTMESIRAEFAGAQQAIEQYWAGK